MGIPYYFSSIIKKYTNNIIKYWDKEKCPIDYLFMDCNSIVYDTFNSSPWVSEESLIKNVCDKIIQYIDHIHPTVLSYVTFDGVAPLAKMEQQKSRRYKAAYLDSSKNGTSWETANITPGTNFMNKLMNAVSTVCQKHKRKILFSGSNVAGEGEHKLFHYLRHNSDKLHSSTIGLYGLDSDLIMLSLLHLHMVKDIFILRELPEYLKSIGNDTFGPKQVHDSNSRPAASQLPANLPVRPQAPLATAPVQDELWCLDTRHLAVGIVKEITNKVWTGAGASGACGRTGRFAGSSGAPLRNGSTVPECCARGRRYADPDAAAERECKDDVFYNIVHDYVFLCFFLGNDFLPHFPSLNIRTFGITLLLDVYHKRIFSKNLTLISIESSSGASLRGYRKKVIWKNVYKVITDLASIERDILLKEHKHRNELSSKIKRFAHKKDNSKNSTDDPIQNIPIMNRGKETYICPEEDGWQIRYYKCLFASHNSDDICFNYLDGLEWVFRYYVSECPDWTWKYNYCYPPLFEDLVKYVQCHKSSLQRNTRPVNPIQQLMYVLPEKYTHLIPVKEPKSLCSVEERSRPSEHVHYSFAYCRYLWESHLDTDVGPVRELATLADTPGDSRQVACLSDANRIPIM